MFIDASVIVAILTNEPDRQELMDQLGGSDGPFYVSATVIFEATVAVARIKHTSTRAAPKPNRATMLEARASVLAFVNGFDAQDIPITASIGKKAVDAASIYGKCVGHKAALNFGDCFSYACAKAYRVPLAYKGNDFKETDLA